MSLISDAEMAAIRGVAESGLKTPVYITRRVVTETANGQQSSWPTEDPVPVLGWLYEFTPGGATIGVISGEMGLSEQVWLRMAAGTDAHSGDRARVGTDIYTIEHTNNESTYQPWLVCAVRLVV